MENKAPAYIRLESSNLDGVIYDHAKSTLEVRFKNGSSYKYFGVHEDAYVAFIKSESAGKHFNQFVKNAYKFEKLDPWAPSIPTAPTDQRLK